MNLLQQPEYDFLRKDPKLGDNICLLGYGGSYAYGANVEDSDVDIRGIALNSKEELFTDSCFEQIVDNTTDTTIYSLNKIFKLLMNCNPNVIEMLGLKEYFILTDIGQVLVNNASIFLSKRCIYTFGGYASSQLKRLENKTFTTVDQTKQEEYILRSIEYSLQDFCSKYGIDYSSFRCYTEVSNKENFDTEIFIDWNINKIPIRDVQDFFNSANQVIKSYNSIGQRNEKALSHGKINKHAMHLVRLLHMCLDILYEGKIITYREKDHDLLMDIRNGKYSNDNGTLNSEFYEMVTELENKLEIAKIDRAVVVPDKIDYKKCRALLYILNDIATTD